MSNLNTEDKAIVGAAVGFGCLFILYWVAIIAIVVGGAVFIWQQVIH